MRIAQVAPLAESVPPKLYGGTERIVAYLTEELVAMGHDVTLFASGDSRTNAKLIPVTPTALRLDPSCRDPLAHHILALELVTQRLREFDIIHYHCDYIHFPLSRRSSVPQLTTLHGRLDLTDLPAIFEQFSDMPVVSISNAQRLPLPQAGWCANIYHGLPLDKYRLHSEPGKYLAFVGRICPEKRPDRAIEIARRAGRLLKIAAKVDTADREYFETTIKPLLDDPSVEFVGEISDAEKDDFLGNAEALLFPIDWPEPFGLVMIESIACGTPVIAFGHGSVPEIIDHGKSGFIVDSVAHAAIAVDQVPNLSRQQCREIFEKRFGARRMAEDYLEVYERLCTEHRSEPRPPIAAE